MTTSIRQRRSRSVRAATEGTEADFQRRITDYAQLRGWMFAHIPDSRRAAAGTPGFPDLVLVREDVVLFVEVKTERGKLSAAQNAWQGALLDAGQPVFVWYPSKWEMIQEVLH